MNSELSIGLAELLTWNDEAARDWKSHLEANPALLECSCDIGNTGNVLGLIRHIWGVELRWANRIAGIENTELATGPVDTLFSMHTQANDKMRGLLEATPANWNEPYVLNLEWVPEHKRRISRRKVMAHALFHSHRHYAQLATLARRAGFPIKFWGYMLFSAALS
jgi:uncharacterized damage-inducible protein DinB